MYVRNAVMCIGIGRMTRSATNASNAITVKACVKGHSWKIPKLPFQYRFITMQFLTATKNTFSAVEFHRPEASVVSDGIKSHVRFAEMFKEYVGRVISVDEIGKAFPWVHVTIGNANTRLANIYHGIKPEFLQGYLNEFYYKFNRRYFGERLFDRMLVAANSYSPSFKSRVYNSTMATF